MKKRLSTLPILLLLFFCLTLSISSLSVYAKSAPKLNKKNITLYVGKSYQLKVKGVKNFKIKWISNKKKIATVTKKGKVVGKKSGTAIITAKIGRKKLKCKIKVIKKKPYAKHPTSQNPEFSSILNSLKNSILKSGYTDSSGLPSIMSESATTKSIKKSNISYDNASNTISFRYINRQDFIHIVTMSMKLGNNIDVVANYKRADTYGFYYTSSTHLTPAKHTGSTIYTFINSDGNYVDTQNVSANTQLRDAFYEWNSLLIKYGFSMKSIGWTSY